ncbi:MAG: hypothetical protein KDD38_03975 [Bdellovibrionales bacterium]|nr:hypothetical protein [Bdellovibrionales bacterium]
MRPVVFWILLALAFRSSAWAGEIFNCTGDLLTFGIDKKSMKQLNSTTFNEFSIDRNKYLSLSFTMDAVNELAKVYPWNGVHFKKSPYADKAGAKLTFTSDGENWFQVQVSLGKLSKNLNCQYRQF